MSVKIYAMNFYQHVNHIFFILSGNSVPLVLVHWVIISFSVLWAIWIGDCLDWSTFAHYNPCYCCAQHLAYRMLKPVHLLNKQCYRNDKLLSLLIVCLLIDKGVVHCAPTIGFEAMPRKHLSYFRFPDCFKFSNSTARQLSAIFLNLQMLD